MEQALAHYEGDADFESSARTYGALLRHRGVQRAMDLFRIVLGYSILDLSLRQLGAWCVVAELVDISKTALLRRLQHCHVWLGYLIARALLRQKVHFPKGIHLRIKLFDATVIHPPGKDAQPWRWHVGFDLMRPALDWVQITTGKGAENLNRFELEAGDLCIADRAYALLSSVLAVITQGAFLIIRIGWFRQPGLRQGDGQALPIVPWLQKNAPPAQGQPFETTVWLSGQTDPLRLIARAIPEQEAEEARRRLRKEAAKKGRTIDERSLIAAGFVMVITNLSATAYSTGKVLELYRFRWQIELVFKRLKSLAGLDQLRAHDPDLALTYLYGKLLGALLLDRFVGQVRRCCPTWFTSTDHPVSLWRLTALLWDQIRIIVRGQISLEDIYSALPRLKRFLCDEPRQRISQFAAAQNFWETLTYA